MAPLGTQIEKRIEIIGFVPCELKPADLLVWPTVSTGLPHP